MNKLSNLLQEAKPLYRRNKQRKTMAKLIFIVSMPMMLLGGMIQLYTQGENLYFALETNSLQTELMENDFALGL